MSQRNNEERVAVQCEMWCYSEGDILTPSSYSLPGGTAGLLKGLSKGELKD